MAQCAGGRRLCITKNGYTGMVPPLYEPTDVVCIILVVKTLNNICRSRDDGAFYDLVGECHVHGIVDGEMEPLAFV